MTESARHANSIKRIKVMLRELGAEIRENSDSRGLGGYQLPGIWNDEECLFMQFTLDIFAILKTRVPIAIEIDYHYKGTPRAVAKMHVRDFWLEKFGIKTVRLTPLMVDDMTAKQLQDEIDWKLGLKKAEVITP